MMVTFPLRQLILVVILDHVWSSDHLESKNNRSAKILSVLRIIKFNNAPCTGNGGLRSGICYTTNECVSKGGASSGVCASGFGVCCIFTLNCGAKSSENCTYLIQDSFTGSIANLCKYRICKCSHDVCRIRFDFNTFNIQGPYEGEAVTITPTVVGNAGSIGDCKSDQFFITAPGNFAPPVICGFNSGQHRDDGCLQYFTGDSGTVASYNFPTTDMILAATTTHLSSQCYTMCWRQEMGTCAICWSPTIPGDGISVTGSFGLSIPVNANARGEKGGKCRGDYLHIPGGVTITTTDPTNVFIIGSVPEANFMQDRYCGRFFSGASPRNERLESRTICTQTRPFRMTFKTDEDEIDISPTNLVDANLAETNRIPGGIVGFNLKWSLQGC